MKNSDFRISGHLIDIQKRQILDREIIIKNGRISEIREFNNVQDLYIMPGFVDSHVHIESSMLSPESFSEIASKAGTIAVVSDPHEIANICGTEGIDYMIKSAKRGIIKFFFGAPSCVPATAFETSIYTG